MCQMYTLNLWLKRVIKDIILDAYRAISLPKTDCNAQIDGVTIPNWKGVVGGYSVEATNERGQKALDFAERHKLVIANTLIKHKRSRLVSSRALNGQSYQINFMIVRKKIKTFYSNETYKNLSCSRRWE